MISAYDSAEICRSSSWKRRVLPNRQRRTYLALPTQPSVRFTPLEDLGGQFWCLMLCGKAYLIAVSA